MGDVQNGVHQASEHESYVMPQDPILQERLEWFRDLKLGFMMHWAPVTQLGLIESWPLSCGDADWSQTEIDWTEDIDEFKKQYWDLNKTFNPIKFRPDLWAKLAKECGFNYLLFTTKHHDGFCMYDTHQTDYKITHEDCPFAKHKYADITKHMFDAFRTEGLAVAAYFSKPDWHSQYFWCDELGEALTKNTNYDIAEHPDLWEKYIDFTHEQLREITSEYGKIDVLWLDGGWVHPGNGEYAQDIHLERIIPEIREKYQPHLIVCDRTVGGEYENVVTPEQEIPKEPLDIPWESCITVGDSFSFHYGDCYKTGRQLVHLLLEIVAKGGNLALNITPQPDGGLPKEAVQAIRDLGAWLHIFGEGIYGTRIAKGVLSAQQTWYTQKNNHVYAFRLYNDCVELPQFTYFSAPRPVKRIVSIRTNQEMPFEQIGGEVIVSTKCLSLREAKYAEGFRFEFR